MTHPVGTRGFNHWFSAALAEFELHFFSLQYFGNANPDGEKSNPLGGPK